MVQGKVEEEVDDHIVIDPEGEEVIEEQYDKLSRY